MSAGSPVISVRPVPTPGYFDPPAGAVGLPLRVVAFAALSSLAALRWGTLLYPVPTGRLLALVGVAVALAVVGPPLVARSRILALLAGLVAVVAMLAISGLPMAWIGHARIALSATAIGDGLAALPSLLLPYRGVNESVRMVMLMGAGVLLLDAAVMMAFAMGPSTDTPPSSGVAGAGARAGATDGPGGDLRRAIAALPLIALAAVPLTLVPARLPYIQGLMLFVLVAALVWGERLPRARWGAAALACSTAAVAAMVVAPALDAHKAWINYQTLANGLAAGPAETFDWSQSYGRLDWPQDGREVLEVQAARPAYWKAADLDVVGPGGWLAAPGAGAAGAFGTGAGAAGAGTGAAGAGAGARWPTGISAASLRRWTQTLTVTIGAMKTRDIVGAGQFGPPTDAPQAVVPGAAPGTWQTVRPLDDGDAYRVAAYSPTPAPSQLAAAGTAYPQSVRAGELDVELPSAGSSPDTTTVYFAPFGAPAGSLVGAGRERQAAAVAASPYAAAYALARRLRAGVATPYAYVKRVLAYFGHGFSYDINPPASRYPLASFLSDSHRGYCQQFAGAMALLLRMGGVPARVAAGFTSGQQQAGSHRWVVSDYDAHAWVEAFFPGYGWVTFDPTPAADPALARTLHTSLLSAAGTSLPAASEALGHRVNGSAGAATRTTAARHSGGLPAFVVPTIAVGVLLAGLGGIALVRRPSSPDQLLDELERAFARSGRPLAPQVTLTELERRLESGSPAQAYVRALGRARFAGDGPAPSPAGRRALRAHLRSGLGPPGPLRALWALPPRRWGGWTAPAEEPDGPQSAQLG